jgi:hypothetical protein
MPSQEEYKRIVADKQKCPKCGGHLDDVKFTTCSHCRHSRVESKEERALRQSLMSTFGVYKDETGYHKLENQKPETLREQVERESVEWFKNFEYTGSLESKVIPIIADKENAKANILDFSAGTVRISRSEVKKFNTILVLPSSLSSFKNVIRCCLCNKVISFNQRPVWYHSIKYTVKHFHYFICSDKQSLEEQKPSTRCYQRD